MPPKLRSFIDFVVAAFAALDNVERLLFVAWT